MKRRVVNYDGGRRRVLGWYVECDACEATSAQTRRKADALRMAKRDGYVVGKKHETDRCSACAAKGTR